VNADQTDPTITPMRVNRLERQIAAASRQVSPQEVYDNLHTGSNLPRCLISRCDANCFYKRHIIPLRTGLGTWTCKTCQNLSPLFESCHVALRLKQRRLIRFLVPRTVLNISGVHWYRQMHKSSNLNWRCGSDVPSDDDLGTHSVKFGGYSRAMVVLFISIHNNRLTSLI
jgi:hypothetical protein